jgi:type I restriction enzyme, R subunit
MTAKAEKARLLRIDERRFVEEPFLKQLHGLGWEILDLDGATQTPKDSHRKDFAEVVMHSVLRERLRIINPWLQEDQLDEVVYRITTVPSKNLVENNQYVQGLIWEGTSVAENRQTGERSPSVRYVDFAKRDNNRFIAVCQFKVRIPGTEKHIKPDIVLFLNGLPIVVIECKSPKCEEPIAEAIDQLMRYSEQRGYENEGVPALFVSNQILVGTCRQEARAGSITSHIPKHFYRWSDPYPKKLNDLEHGASSPNDQQRLVAGMFDRNNLLDLIQTYTLFTTNEEDELIKIVARYQQFRAVKLAVKRLLEGKNKFERSGIIWHTQGSGKSLTMMFMVREMYNHPKLSNWKIVFVTDRTQLESQLSQTGSGVGYKVKVASSIKDLKEKLANDSSDLVMAMIQKFQEHDLSATFPQLNMSPNILVMTDEAHRTQYDMLRANLDRAMPNAADIAYTGTPIEKTKKVFGDYIDKYTMRQAIEDKVTLEIVYEGRTYNAEVDDPVAMDKAFADVFSEYTLEERLQILGYASRQAYLEAEATIDAKARDMVEHYVTQIFPNGYKAQVVAVSREAAARYKTAIDRAIGEKIVELERSNPNNIDTNRLKTLKTGVVISDQHNDPPHLASYGDTSKHEGIIASFKLSFGTEKSGIKGDTGIVIVNNMLLTGFDAPVEQVMYLDKVIKAHNLLQAIARVNRIGGKGKDVGFVVDYVGVGHHLKDAIDTYDEEEQKEILFCLDSIEEEINNLVTAQKKMSEFLEQNGMTYFGDYDAFFDLFYDEEIRYKFIVLYDEYTKALNAVFPRKEALDYIKDYNIVTEINVMAGRHFHDGRLSMKGIPEKLRAIADVYLKDKGIDLKIAPISIISPKFDEQIGERKRIKTKAAEIEHAIRHYIEENEDDDPELYAEFSTIMEHILEEEKNNWEAIYRKLEGLRSKIKDAASEPTYGLHRKKQMPFFRILRKELFGANNLTEDQISTLVALTKDLFDLIEREISLTEFWNSPAACNKLQGEIQNVLLSPSYTDLPGIVQKRKIIITRLMELAESKSDTILYAA